MEQGQATVTAAMEDTRRRPAPAAKRAVRKSPPSFELTDDQCTMIANRVVAQLEVLGAFESPPERLVPAPISAPEHPGPLPQAQEQPQAPKTFAERWRGY